MNEYVCKNTDTNMKKVHLDIVLPENEINNLKLIMNKVTCCNQAASPGAIPDGIDGEKVTLFVKAALDALAEARTLQEYWWSTIKQTYQLPPDKNVWVDFTTGELYTLE